MFDQKEVENLKYPGRTSYQFRERQAAEEDVPKIPGWTGSCLQSTYTRECGEFS
jgi:hypothetical protein